MKTKDKTTIEFLRESNAIERVYDEDSLQQAFYAWEYLLSQKTLTHDVIKKTHKILMLNQGLRPNEKGYFRTVPVYIGGREALDSDWIDHDIMLWLQNVNDVVRNTKKGTKGDIRFKENITKKHHVMYENIHPFVDGNGRTGRMFMNWERLKIGLPILVIHEGKEQMEYYKWFK